jgi:hypothetical protein
LPVFSFRRGGPEAPLSGAGGRSGAEIGLPAVLTPLSGIRIHGEAYAVFLTSVRGRRYSSYVVKKGDSTLGGAIHDTAEMELPTDIRGRVIWVLNRLVEKPKK